MNRPIICRLATRSLLPLAVLLTIATAQAAVVAIHIEDNYTQTAKFSQENGDGSTYISALYEDLTGDGVADVEIDNEYYNVGLSFQRDVTLSFDMDGVSQYAHNGEVSSYYKLGSSDGKRLDVGPVTSAGYRRGVSKVTFEDVRINGGAATEAWLVVESTNIGVLGAHRISLTKLVFDDSSTTIGITPDDAITGSFNEFDPTSVPEPSTSLLVSLCGVACLMRRRRS